MSVLRRTQCFIVFELFLAPLALAQAPTAQITGLITDASGAVIGGARISATEITTGTTIETSSNADGNYVFPVLRAGTYQITVSKEGFERVQRSGIDLAVSQVARLDFKLQIGSVNQTVDVTSSAPLLESSSASLGQVIDTKPINDLPLNGRNFLQLAKLATGVLPPKPGDREAAGGSFTANGVYAQFNNFQLDGVDNNAKVVDQQNASPVAIQPSVDALQEFKVETNNYSAEYGYSAGAVVNAIVKSGTNQFHGTAFEFFRNDALDARSFFLAPSSAKPALRRNQPGGTVGGPIIKNKVFFFGSYERTDLTSGNTLVSTVPTQVLKAGSFAGQPTIYDPASTTCITASNCSRTAFAGNVIPAARITPAASNLLAIEPLPTLAQNINNYVVSPNLTQAINRIDTRGDYYISERDQLFGRYSFFDSNLVNPGPFPPPLVGSSSFKTANEATVGNGAALGETHTFGPIFVNEFRLGYNRIQDFLTPFEKNDVDSQFGLDGIPQQPGVTGLPQMSITGYAGLGEATFLPNDKISEAVIAEDHVSWVLGKHSLKIGGDYRWVRSWFYISSAARGSYSFSGAFTENPQQRSTTGSALADFMLGTPNTSELSNSISGDLRYNYSGAFVQDDWKVTDRLTLNLGIRYELWTQPVERQNQQANFLLDQSKLVYPYGATPSGVPSSAITNVPVGDGPRSLLRNDTNNVAPRLGVAYQATPKTVLRAGFGTFFADDPFVGASGRLVANPPFYKDSTFPTDQITPILALGTGFPSNTLSNSVNLANASLVAWTPNFKQAYVYHWSAGVQQQIGQYVLETDYVGTKGTQLPVSYNVNSPFAGPGSVASRRAYQGFGNIALTTPMGDSSYNALQVRIQRQYQNGLSLLASYTYSKTLDDGGEQLIGDLALRDARNVKAEYGLSAQDLRHNFVLSSLYDLPFGSGQRFHIANSFANAVLGNWQLNGIATLHSGQPFTPELSFSTANTGDNRPNRIADGNLPGGQRGINDWFQKSAFVAATGYNFGNAGRDILEGPGAVNFDLSIFKQFPLPLLGESGLLQLRGESFNAFNHPQFAMPNNTVNIPQGGTITSLSNTMREMQLAVKIIF